MKIFSAPCCIALTSGLSPHAGAFPLAALTGRNTLLGTIPPLLPDFPLLSGSGLLDEKGLASLPEYGCARLLWPCPQMEGIGSEGLASKGGEQLHVPAPVFLAETVTSTFAVAWKLVEDGMLPPWGAVLAQRQTEGRGQLRRFWESPPGNLYVSFRLPDDPVLRSGPASLITAYFLAAAFKAMGISLLLKWPNDLLNALQEKAGGILLEERDGVVLAGVGINLVSSPDERRLREGAAAPAGLLYACGETAGKCIPAPFFLWRSLVARAVVEYTDSVARRSFADIRFCLEPYLAWKGQRVVVRDSDGSCLSGRYEGLGPEGGANLLLDNGQQREIYSGGLFREQNP